MDRQIERRKKIYVYVMYIITIIIIMYRQQTSKDLELD
jgi:t-SNARE complex subunit (syntaxin)